MEREEKEMIQDRGRGKEDAKVESGKIEKGRSG